MEGRVGSAPARPRSSQHRYLCLCPRAGSSCLASLLRWGLAAAKARPGQEHPPPIAHLAAAAGISHRFLASTAGTHRRRHPPLPRSPSGWAGDFCSTHPSTAGSHPLLPEGKRLKHNQHGPSALERMDPCDSFDPDPSCSLVTTTPFSGRPWGRVAPLARLPRLWPPRAAPAPLCRSLPQRSSL